MKIAKLTKKNYEKAQLLYFSGRDISEIAVALTVEPETLRYYIFGEDGDGKDKNTWYALKKQMNPTAMAIYLKDKVAILDQTAGVALEILSMGLFRLRQSLIDDPHAMIDIDSMSKLSSIQVNLDKVARLETGKATEIMEHMGLSLAEAREIMDSDPFALAIESEVVTVPWEGDAVTDSLD